MSYAKRRLKQVCKNDHDLRIKGRTKSGHCRECERLRILKYGRTERGKTLARARQKRFRENNPCAFCHKELLARCKRVGITVEQYAALPRHCAICLSKDPKSRYQDFHLDHDHKTGKFRGLLCGPCNHALGLINDNPEVAIRMAAWLR